MKKMMEVVQDNLLSLPQKEFTQTVYAKLFKKIPEAREMFKNDLEVQGQKLMATIGSAIMFLDNEVASTITFQSLGYRHSEWSVEPRHYDAFKSCFMETLKEFLGPRFDDATKEVWEYLLDKVISVMLRGNQ